jgi:hypothetical protein
VLAVSDNERWRTRVTGGYREAGHAQAGSGFPGGGVIMWGKCIIMALLRKGCVHYNVAVVQSRTSLKLQWGIVMGPPGICGVHYKSTTWTPRFLLIWRAYCTFIQSILTNTGALYVTLLQVFCASEVLQPQLRPLQGHWHNRRFFPNTMKAKCKFMQLRERFPENKMQ